MDVVEKELEEHDKKETDTKEDDVKLGKTIRKRGTANENIESSESEEGSSEHVLYATSSSTETVSSESEDSLSSSWEYVQETMSPSAEASQSQPCFSKRGVSYTPPGWKRKYKSSKKKTTTSKKLKFDN